MEPSHSHSSNMKVSLITSSTRPFTSRRRYRLFNSTINELESHGGINDSYRFILMSLLTSTMMLAEIVTGVTTGSLTLLSDALHMLSDLIALIIGYTAHRMANGKANSSSSSHTFEHAMVYMRYEIVGALINGTILLTSCFIMALEAIQRILFFHEEIEQINYVLIVGGLGLAINLIGLFIFGHHGHDHSHSHSHGHSPHNHKHNHKHKIAKKHRSHTHSYDTSFEANGTEIDVDIDIDIDIGNDTENEHEHEHKHKHKHNHKHSEENLNIRGVFLHILGDLLGSVAVMISALIIKFTSGWWTKYIDPVCTLLIVMLISKTAWPLVKQSANILLDKSPFNSSIISEMEKQLCSISGVLNVHELHCWEVKTGYYMATVHLIIDPHWNDTEHTDKYCVDNCNILHDKMTIIDQSKQILHKYGIHSSIVQSEFPHEDDKEWKNANDPCFDYVCNTSDCIKKSKALSNSMANLKKNSFTNNNNINNNNVNIVEEEIQLTKEHHKINT